jgi:GntR family transcriptional regulator, carbon starvation induced regulator
VRLVRSRTTSKARLAPHRVGGAGVGGPDQVPKGVTDGDGAPSQTIHVFGQIRADILAGKLEPSSRLKLEELRETYATGLSPLREALSLLTSERLVDRIDQRGFRVAPATIAEFTDVLDTRCWLEERALRRSMQHTSPEWEERILVAHHRLERLERSSGTDGPHVNPSWETSHRAFHMELLAACGSTILLRFCEQLYDMNVRYRQIGSITGYPRRNIKSEHKAILEAVLARDVERAVAHLTEHYRRTGVYLKKGLVQIKDALS